MWRRDSTPFGFANPDTTPSDIGNYSGGSLTLNTLYALDPSTGSCFRIPAGTPNGVGVTAGGSDAPCDPTKGFRIDPTSAATFGQIINKHGHRRIELALKFYF